MIVTASGFPPGQWRMRCAARDKDGRYLGSSYTRDFEEPASASADSMLIYVGPGKADEITGADCTAIPRKVVRKKSAVPEKVAWPNTARSEKVAPWKD